MRKSGSKRARNSKQKTSLKTLRASTRWAWKEILSDAIPDSWPEASGSIWDFVPGLFMVGMTLAKNTGWAAEHLHGLWIVGVIVSVMSFARTSLRRRATMRARGRRRRGNQRKNLAAMGRS